MITKSWATDVKIRIFHIVVKRLKVFEDNFVFLFFSLSVDYNFGFKPNGQFKNGETLSSVTKPNRISTYIEL